MPIELYRGISDADLAAIVAEGLSFRTAIRESNKVRGKQTWSKYIRAAKAPELR